MEMNYSFTYTDKYGLPLTEEEVESTFRSVFSNIFPSPKERNERSIKIYTGVGGMDMFEEGMELGCGFKRYKIDKAPPRFLKDLVRFHKSRTGKYYRLLKIAP